jgi:outer membrane protein TolC
MQAEVDWRNLDSEAQAALQNFQVILLQFKNMAGIDLDTYISFNDADQAGESIQASLPETPAVPDIAAVLSRNSGYKVEQLQSDLAILEKEAALKAFIPSLSLSLNYGWANMKGSGNDKSLNPKSGKWLSNTAGATAQQQLNFGLNIKIPIIEGGYRLAKIKEAEAAKEQASTNLENKERGIRLKLAQIQQKLASDISQVRNYILIQETAERGLQTAQTSFANGAITRLDLADARNQAQQARLGYENAAYNLACDWFDWEEATGQIGNS